MVSVAIDGPAGAGKSTLARRLAAEMGYIYVDTGAMFRTIGLYALRAGKDPKDNEAVNALLPEIELHFAFIDGEQHVYLKEEDVSTAIRTEEVGMAASAVGANPAVRAFLLGMQRDMAKKQDVLMDGRDIGTVVLPDATVKIFLTASPEARAARRWKEYQEKGVNTPYEEVLADVKQRDYQDTHRAAAPLKQAEDAVAEMGVGGFTALRALTTCADVERASIPFDKERSGFVMGEGAGVVVLEELEHAKARGAKIYAELVGYGATCDAFHITSPAEDGSGAAKAMEYAMADGGVKPEQIDYVNAHGTGTHHNDLFETKAIKLALGDHARDVHINSTKSMIGHLLGAAGGVEFIVCVKSIEDGFVHATAGLEVADEECDLDYTKGEGISTDVNYAISNSLGFGGHNASLLVKRFEE